MELEKELAYYNAQREELLSHHEGQFALIKANSCLGYFTTEGEAYEEGVKQFGNQAFLIKQITKEKEINRVPALVLGLINAPV